MDVRSSLMIAGVCAGAVAFLAACGGGGSASGNLQNSVGGGNVGAGAGVSSPSAPGGTNANGPGATIDACTAMSASAASQISGGNVTKVSGTKASGGSVCSYADQAHHVGAVAIIESIPGVTGTAALQAAINQPAVGGAGNAQPLGGLGDAALKDVEAHAATVAFSKGNTVVVVAVYGSTRDGGSIESDLESLAQQIADKV